MRYIRSFSKITFLLCVLFPFYSSFGQSATPVLIDFAKKHLGEEFNEPEWTQWQKAITDEHVVKWTDKDMINFLHLLTKKIRIDQTLKKIQQTDYFHHHTYLEFTQRIELFTSYMDEDAVWLWVDILTLKEFHLGHNVQKTIHWFENYIGRQETSRLMQESFFFFLMASPRQLVHIENLLNEFCGMSREDIKENIKNNHLFLRFILTAQYAPLKNVIALLTDDRGFQMSQVRAMIEKYPDAFTVARDYYLESSIDILEMIFKTEEDTNKVIEKSFNTLVNSTITQSQFKELIDFMTYNNRFTMKSIRTMITQNFYAFLNIAKLLVEILEAKGYNRINIKYTMIQTFEILSYMDEDMVVHFHKSIELKESSIDTSIGKERVESGVIEFMYNFGFTTDEILTMLKQNPVAFFMFTKPLVQHFSFFTQIENMKFIKEKTKNTLIDLFKKLAGIKDIDEFKDIMRDFNIEESKLFQRTYSCTVSLEN